MKVIFAGLKSELSPHIRALIQDPEHQFAFDPDILKEPMGTVHVISPDITFHTSRDPSPNASTSKVNIDKLYKAFHKGVWPIAKETLPFNNPTMEGSEILFAGKKLWDRLTAEGEKDKVQIVLAATDFGLEVYDLLSKCYPSLQVAQPYRTYAGLLVNGVDATYAVYFTEDT